MSTKELQEIKFPEQKEVEKKATITLPKNATVKTFDAANDEDSDDKVSNFDLASILQLHKGIQGESLPKGLNDANPEVKSIFKETNELVELNKRYREDYLIRGTQALYEFLSGTYRLGIQIEKSDFKEKVIAMMRDDLKSRDIRTQANTPPMTVLIKYIVGADRQTAANYSRVLSIAMQDKVPFEELSEYISRRGGISQIHEIESKAITKKLGAAESKERLDILREIMILTGYTENHIIDSDIEVLQHNPEKNTAAERGSFCFFMTVYDETNENYRVVSAHDLGSSLENDVLKIILRGKPNNLNRLRTSLRGIQDAIIRGEIGNESLKSRCENFIKRANEEKKESKNG